MASRKQADPVEAFMARLDHPQKAEIEAIRRVIRGAHPAITEEIKWNAPSFRTTEHFATLNLRVKGGVGVIFHRGARAREMPASGMAIRDPQAMLRWLDKDRAIVQFSDLDDVRARKAALAEIVCQWVERV